MRKINYSCVVDTHEKFKKQGWLWLNSLIKLGGVDPANIWVHCINGMGGGYVARLRATGANIVMSEPFGDRKYCNKIPQMGNAQLKAGDAVILMDTDMIMLENFEDTLDFDCISAKIVDLANPPTEVIDAVFALAGQQKKLPDHFIECEKIATYGANFNGGLYVIPQKYYDIIGAGWKKWAEWLLANGKPMYDAGREAHIDQVSFCMAVHEHAPGIKIKHLDRRYNYPLPYDFGEREQMPYVLHYHDRVDDNFLLSPDYEPRANIKKAVDKANAFIAQNI